MADISILSRLINGIQRNVDLSQNTIVVGSVKVGISSPTELTKAILDRLVSLQNGSDVDATYHTHDGRYYTESELGSATASSGSDLIGDDDTYSNFTPAAATVKGALSGIDSALASVADEKVGVSANDTTPGYLEDKIVVDVGTNSTNALESSTLNDGGDEDLRIRLDISKIDHGSLAGLGDDDHTIYTKADGTRAFTGAQSMGGFKLTNLADPTADQDAVTKAYLDAREAGLKPKEAVRVAADSDIDISTELEDGDTVDGVVVATGERVLLMGQTDPAENGIYVVVASGAASRSTDFDSLSPIDEINRAWVPVQEGTSAGKVFVQYGTVSTLDTDDINFEWYDPIAALVGGDMITKTGSTLTVDLSTDAGLESSNPGNVAGQLRVKLDGSTLARSSSGLKVADAGITETQLAASVAGAGLAGGAGSALSVNVDDSSIEISTDTLQVKAAGITETHLNTSVAGDGLDGGGGTALSVNVSDLAGSGLENDGSNNLRIAAAAAGAGLAGGAGSALSVVYSPSVQAAGEIAGESYSAATLYAVRYGQDAETAGRIYKADNDASSVDNFHVIGLALTVGALSAAGTMPNIYKMGPMTVTGHGFTVGKPIFLDAAGTLTSTAPSSADEAAVKVGMAKDANIIDVQIQIMGVN